MEDRELDGFRMSSILAEEYIGDYEDDSLLGY
jgi:hypothetical protein